MIAILLLLAFNWLILFLMICFFFGFHHLSQLEFFVFGFSAFGIVCILAFLFNSPFGQGLLRLLSGARNAISSETARINPVIEQVQQNITEQLGLPPMPIKLMVTDSPLPNAFAIGKNTLVLSRTLYETSNDDELAAVIAHEFAHLHNGDSHRLGIALGVSLISLTITAVSWIVLRLFAALQKGAGKSDGGAAIVLFALVFAIFAGVFWLISKLGNFLLRLITLFTGRKEEYEADKFALKAGYGAGLIAFLNKIKNLEFGKPLTILDRLYATHPAIMLRIGELEKLMDI